MGRSTGGRDFAQNPPLAHFRGVTNKISAGRPAGGRFILARVGKANQAGAIRAAGVNIRAAALVGGHNAKAGHKTGSGGIVEFLGEDGSMGCIGSDNAQAEIGSANHRATSAEPRTIETAPNVRLRIPSGIFVSWKEREVSSNGCRIERQFLYELCI